MRKTFFPPFFTIHKPILPVNLVNYRAKIFGPVEREVVLWGKWTIYAGIISVIGAFLPKTIQFVRLIGMTGYLAVALSQIPPIILWFIFHGYAITEYVHESTFAAHFLHASPHVLLLIIGILCFLALKNAKRPYIF